MWRCWVRDCVGAPRLEVGYRVADAGIAGDVHALARGIRELGRDRARQAEAERRDVAPAEEAARNVGLVDGARLIPRVARISGHERILGIENLHEIAEHAIRIDRRLVRFEPRPELRHELLAGGPDLLEQGGVLATAARPLAELLAERLQRQPALSHHPLPPAPSP